MEVAPLIGNSTMEDTDEGTRSADGGAGLQRETSSLSQHSDQAPIGFSGPILENPTITSWRPRIAATAIPPNLRVRKPAHEIRPRC